MKLLYLGLGCFLLIYVLYLITVIFNKKKIKNFYNTTQAKYFIYKYKLDTNKLNARGFANAIALSNSIMISLTLIATEITKNYYLKILVGIVTLVPLMLIIYSIIGNIYKKKEGKKNV